MRSALILGASSGIAKALAYELAKQGTQLALSGRNQASLDALAADLVLRCQCPKPATVLLDARDTAGHHHAYRSVIRQIGAVDEVYLFFAVMHDQVAAEKDFHLAADMIRANYLGAVSILEIIARDMEARGRGKIIGVSSVAGERGRQSNYLYGSTKSALTAYLSGLRNRLTVKNVHVMTVKPGPVDTPMLIGSGMENSPLVVSPQSVAKGILKALDKNRNTVYLPGYWWLIMSVIRAIPEAIFKKLKL